MAESTVCSLELSDVTESTFFPVSKNHERLRDLDWLQINLQKAQRLSSHQESAIIRIERPCLSSLGGHLMVEFWSVREAQQLVEWAARTLGQRSAGPKFSSLER